MMNRLLPIVVLAAACRAPDSDKTGFRIPEDTAAEPDTAVDAEPVTATIRILDPTNGQGMSGISLTGSGVAATTDASGQADAEISGMSDFEFLLEGEGVLDHVLYGEAQDEDFSLITYVGTEAMSEMVLQMLNLSVSPQSGMLVVGVDTTSWAPVVGAEVRILGQQGTAFVIGSTGMPALGQSIPSGGMGMVSFAGLVQGEVEVEVTAPAGFECAPHPGGAYTQVPIYERTVTVVSVQCTAG